MITIANENIRCQERIVSYGHSVKGDNVNSIADVNVIADLDSYFRESEETSE